MFECLINQGIQACDNENNCHLTYLKLKKNRFEAVIKNLKPCTSYRVTFAPSGSQKTAPYPNFEKAVETFPTADKFTILPIQYRENGNVFLNWTSQACAEQYLVTIYKRSNK